MKYTNLLAVIIDPNNVKIPKTDPGAALPNILRIVFGFAGAVALLIITISGLRMVMSQSNPESFNQARNTIIYAVIGLVVSISAFTILTFVINRI